MILLLALLFFAAPAQAQHTHDGVVGEFYSSWYMPDDRKNSCCNEQDCGPVQMIRKDGKWYAVGHFLHPEPIHIPDSKIENYAPDARDSPDGLSHACLSLSAKAPLCAVLGNGM